MTRYRKKPVEVEAWQVGTEPVPEWITLATKDDVRYNNGYHYLIHTDDGLTGYPVEGMYIVRDGYGNCHFEKQDIFEQNYEVVE